VIDFWVQSSEEKEEKRREKFRTATVHQERGRGHSCEEEVAGVLGIMAFVDLGHAREGYMGWPSCPCFLLCFLVSFPFPP
jgi:hypothetical protein